MTSASTYSRSQSIRITFDPNRHHYHYTNRLYSDKRNQQMIDYENSLEAKGLMMHYDRATWRMYERIMNYRCYLDEQEDHEQQDSDDMNLVDDPNHHDHYDGSKSCCNGSNYNSLTLTNLMTEMILQKTANQNNSIKDSIKSSYNTNDMFQQSHYHNKDNDTVLKQQQNSNKVMMMMMMNKSEQEMSSILNTISLTTNMNHNVSNHKESHYNSHSIDFSPKSIITNNDNNEGGLSSLSNTPIKKPMTASLPSDSASNSNNDFKMMMKMSKSLPLPPFPGFSSYDYNPNHHVRLLQDHIDESDHVFELDL